MAEKYKLICFTPIFQTHSRVNAKGLLPYYRAGYLANLKISTLFIKEYKGDDKMVYDYIRSLPNPTYFCAYRYTGYIGFLETGISESSYPYLRESLHVIEQFPNSQFIPSAILGL